MGISKFISISRRRGPRGNVGSFVQQYEGLSSKQRRPMDKTGIRSDRGGMYHQKFYVFVFLLHVDILFSHMFHFFTICFCFCFKMRVFFFENLCFSSVSFGAWHKTSSIIALLITLSFLEKYGVMQTQQCVSLCHVCISAYQSTFLRVFSCFEIFRNILRFFERSGLLK